MNYKPQFLYKNSRDNIILNLCTGKKVLHIGACDYPHTLKKINNKSLLQIKINEVTQYCIGIDIDKNSIKLCKKYGVNNIVFCDLISKHKVTFEYDFDVIVFGEAIEHIVDLKNFINYLKAYMSDKTKLIISTPNAYFIGNFINAFRSFESNHEDHVYSFTPHTLVNNLKKNGLKLQPPIYFTLLDHHLKNGNLIKNTIFKIIIKLFPFLSSTLLAVFVKK
jgi:2-polyprenyl-3-methyl-5-hydroxy-6-metoxy-1,4-benzoquinol methylase